MKMNIETKDFKTSEIKIVCDGTLIHPNVESVYTTIIVKLKEPISEFSKERESIIKSINEEIIYPVQRHSSNNGIQSNNSGE